MLIPMSISTGPYRMRPGSIAHQCKELLVPAVQVQVVGVAVLVEVADLNQ